MDIDTLYKYLKLVVPSNLKVIKREKGDAIDVGVNPEAPFGFIFADTFKIEDGLIKVITISSELPKYISKIFKERVICNESKYRTEVYSFKIPEELRGLNESTKS